MEKLKILKVEDLKTSKGGDYKKVDVEQIGGAVVTGVSAFGFKFPDLASLVVGAEIEGSIVIDGNYKNLVGAIEKPKGNPGYKTAQIEKVMERKEASISTFQDNKELSIKMASTMRMAVDLAIAEYTMNKGSFDKLEELVPKWREFAWNNWDVGSNQYPPSLR